MFNSYIPIESMLCHSEKVLFPLATMPLDLQKDCSQIIGEIW